MSKDKRPTLFHASVALNSLLEQADEDGVVKHDLMEEIRLLTKDVAHGLDKRKFLLKALESRKEMAKNMITDLKKEIAKMEKVKKKVKSSTLESIKLAPEATFRCSIGKKVYAKQGPLRLELDPSIEVRHFNVSNCVPERTACDKRIFPYIVRKTYYTLDTATLREDLKAGKEIEFARLISDEVVCGLS